MTQFCQFRRSIPVWAKLVIQQLPSEAGAVAECPLTGYCPYPLSHAKHCSRRQPDPGTTELKVGQPPNWDLKSRLCTSRQHLTVSGRFIASNWLRWIVGGTPMDPMASWIPTLHTSLLQWHETDLEPRQQPWSDSKFWQVTWSGKLASSRHKTRIWAAFAAYLRKIFEIRRSTNNTGKLIRPLSLKIRRD